MLCMIVCLRCVAEGASMGVPSASDIALGLTYNSGSARALACALMGVGAYMLQHIHMSIDASVYHTCIQCDNAVVNRCDSMYSAGHDSAGSV